MYRKGVLYFSCIALMQIFAGKKMKAQVSISNLEIPQTFGGEQKMFFINHPIMDGEQKSFWANNTFPFKGKKNDFTTN